jgi:hypothetical protein
MKKWEMYGSQNNSLAGYREGKINALNTENGLSRCAFDFHLFGIFPSFFLLAQMSGCPMNSFADAWISTAATEIALHSGINIGIGWIRVFGE